MKRCHHCRIEWISDQARPGFKETCSSCGAYLHCCKNCRFHQPRTHNECSIPTTEWVADRRKANYCGDFQFADSEISTKTAGESAALSPLEELFGGKLRDAGESGPKDFDSLFGG
ncbi:MAG: hypothetical protein AAB353_00565 [Candidatus Hydrogenedentota bacterium]